MTMRHSYRAYASSPSAQVTDPDLDATHPGGQGGAGKYAKGWVPEKEPHQWINFVFQQVDVNFEELLQQGFLIWDASVTYAKGGLTFFNGLTYHALSSNINQQPDTNPTIWDSGVANMSEDDWRITANQFTNDLSAHIAKKGPTQNAHNTTIAQAGGYNKATIDGKFKASIDELSNHKKDFQNPHNLTLAQVNCLPAASGGIFTGLVTMYQMQLMGSANYLAAASGIVSIGNAGGRIGIKGGFPKNITSDEEYVSQESYFRTRSKYEIDFSVREPEYEIPLQGSLHSPSQGSYTLEFSRPSTLNYVDRAGVAQTAAVDEPAFTERGLLLTADTVFGIRTLWSGAATAQLYRDNIPELWDLTLTDGGLINITGVAGSINNLRIWQGPLTIYEKSTRGG